MAKLAFELISGEEILLSNDVIWVHGVIKPTGEIHLTNKRLLVVKQPLLASLFKKVMRGALGAALGALLAHFKSKLVLDLPLKDITHVEPSTYAFNKKVILVHTTSAGELKFVIQITPEEWIRKFEEARRKK
jgi:hypothetical protein